MAWAFATRCEECERAAWVTTWEFEYGLGRRCLHCRGQVVPDRRFGVLVRRRRPSPYPPGANVFNVTMADAAVGVKMEGAGYPAVFENVAMENVGVAFETDGMTPMVLNNVSHKVGTAGQPGRKSRRRRKPRTAG